MTQTLEAIGFRTQDTLGSSYGDLLYRSDDIALPLTTRAAYLGALCVMEETGRANDHYLMARVTADWREGMIALDMQERVASSLGRSVCVPTLRGPEFRPGLERLTIEVEGEPVEISPHNVIGVLHEHALFLNRTTSEQIDAEKSPAHSQTPELPDYPILHSVEPKGDDAPARKRLGILGRVASWFRPGRRLSEA